MSRIDDLIREHCPNGVEFRALGEMAAFRRGRQLRATERTAGAFPVVTASRRSDLTHVKCNFPAGAITITSHGAYAGHVNYWETPIWLANNVFLVEIQPGPMLPRFFFYSLKASQDWLQGAAQGGGVPYINAGDISRLRIPVPPIEVQREIVRILDLFQSLEAELEAELEARRRQYAHYRDRLLVPSTGASEVPLAKLATLRYGYTASAADDGDYRFLRITDITEMGTLNPDGPKFVSATPDATDYLVRAGDLLMARTGATFGKTLYVAEDMDAVYASFLIRIRFDADRLQPRYYWHFAQSELYWRQARALASHGGQPQFNGNALKAVLVPVPSLPEQERIVESLDKFDALVNDLSVGLPAELAARRKQYEYYRDRLLTFEEAA